MKKIEKEPISKTSNVIFNREFAQARTLADEKLIEFFAVQKFDHLLAHQYCVRRFLLNHADHFYAIRSFRNEIDTVLAETPLTNEDRLFMGRSITATARCMRMLDSRNIRNLAQRGAKKEIRQILEDALHSTPYDNSFPILAYLDDDQIAELVNIICDNGALVEEISQDLNFLDYYDPFSLTNLVTGKTMLNHYFRAKYGIYPVHLWASYLSSDNHWLHTREAELDDELSGIVCEYGYLAKRPPSNVRIFGHNQHRITVDGIELPNHLILAVPTSETPINIDTALRDFRSALKTAFIDMRGCYANISTPEFDNSLFMQNFEERTFLVTETKQFRSKMQGLWLWDLVHPSDKRVGLTVTKAIDEATEEAAQQLRGIATDETAYSSDSYKNFYDHAVKQIGPKVGKTKALVRPRELDRFITLSETILGYRRS